MSDEPVYPLFVFVRSRDAEKEAGFVLAGDLVVDVLRGDCAEQEKTQEIVGAFYGALRQIVDQERGWIRDDMWMFWGWRDSVKPANAVDVDDDVLMAPWAVERVVVGVRLDLHDDGVLRMDSDMARQLGLMPEH